VTHAGSKAGRTCRTYVKGRIPPCRGIARPKLRVAIAHYAGRLVSRVVKPLRERVRRETEQRILMAPSSRRITVLKGDAGPGCVGTRDASITFLLCLPVQWYCCCFVCLPSALSLVSAPPVSLLVALFAHSHNTHTHTHTHTHILSSILSRSPQPLLPAISPFAPHIS
jgi:hypothetical protein